jgi:DNA repair protein RecO (recombination protein O)
MAISGFAPLLECCRVCGQKEPERTILDLSGGFISCGGCTAADGAAMSRGALNAARYIVGCDPKKLFSFTLSDDGQRELASITEGYLLAHLDRRFRTLDFYKGLTG